MSTQEMIDSAAMLFGVSILVNVVTLMVVVIGIALMIKWRRTR